MSDFTDIIWTPAELASATIAQDGDDDYESSGYIVARRGEQVGIARYSHNSCYDTFDVLANTDGEWERSGRISWLWVGPLPELVTMAKRRADPALPERAANPKDYDYDHLIAARLTLAEIESHLGVDSLCYLSKAGMVDAARTSSEHFCTACFDGDYPIEMDEETRRSKLMLEPAGMARG